MASAAIWWGQSGSCCTPTLSINSACCHIKRHTDSYSLLQNVAPYTYSSFCYSVHFNVLLVYFIDYWYCVVWVCIQHAQIKSTNISVYILFASSHFLCLCVPIDPNKDIQKLLKPSSSGDLSKELFHHPAGGEEDEESGLSLHTASLLHITEKRRKYPRKVVKGGETENVKQWWIFIGDKEELQSNYRWKMPSPGVTDQ